MNSVDCRHSLVILCQPTVWSYSSTSANAICNQWKKEMCLVSKAECLGNCVIESLFGIVMIHCTFNHITLVAFARFLLLPLPPVNAMGIHRFFKLPGDENSLSLGAKSPWSIKGNCLVSWKGPRSGMIPSALVEQPEQALYQLIEFYGGTNDR